ncbi:uncharacterized protein BKA55DRAFT_558617 [Fusarium redolens]|uniref:Uncharacterized protein n=1 Tax=Fusarium redolens TaxID=48865 RepID=A0A9P9HXJ0_FUSRE|nr:uncharacterized protein BKA55DRAFT_558617 [Fusarium redolens]KAH7265322.1 hypothetical protein BKA55DRAFT_558617 [Fusarium redolens]
MVVTKVIRAPLAAYFCLQLGLCHIQYQRFCTLSAAVSGHFQHHFTENCAPQIIVAADPLHPLHCIRCWTLDSAR